MKVPIVDLSECILCGVCVDVCPSVFQMNEAGYVEIIPLDTYPENEVDDAIKNCPTNCIHWESQ